MNRPVYDVMDVARYIIHYHNTHFKNYGIDGLKLQKLLFILQGAYLMHVGTPLFKEEFIAWSCGPSIPSISKEFISKYGSLWIPELAIRYVYIEEKNALFGHVLEEWENPLLEEDKQCINQMCHLFKHVSSVKMLDMIREHFPCFTEREDKQLNIPNKCIKEDYQNMVQALKKKHDKNKERNKKTMVKQTTEKPIVFNTCIQIDYNGENVYLAAENASGCTYGVASKKELVERIVNYVLDTVDPDNEFVASVTEASTEGE